MRRKLVATLAMAGLLTLTAVTPVLASDYQITINNSTSGNVETAKHDMKAYQIFTGTIDGDKLIGIEWGTGFNGDALIAALKADETIGSRFTNATTAADVAKGLEKMNAAEVQALNAVLAAAEKSNGISNNGTDTIDVAAPGYYFIQDETEIGEGDALSDYILRVLGKETIKIKTDAPKVEKKILDGAIKVDANTASIGEKVDYQIKATVPDTSDYSEFYFYYLTDTFSDGLSYNQDAVVWLDKNGNAVMDAGEELVKAAPGVTNPDYKLTEEGQTVTIAMLDMLTMGKNYAGKDLYVDYSADVTEEAVIGNTGNPNTVDLTYSNNPTIDYKPTQTEKENGKPANEEGENSPVGKTPEDKVITYVTKLDLTKYADSKAAGNELEGAEFTLTGTAYKTVLKTETYYKKDAAGTFYLLKDGTYTETAPDTTNVTSMRLRTTDDAQDAGWVVREEGDDTVTGVADIVVNGVTYRAYVASKDANATVYVQTTTKGNADLYSSITDKYILVTATTTDRVAYAVTKTYTTGENGKISFEGLDEGTYTLSETVVPEGFNKCEDINFTLTATGLPTEVKTGTETVQWSSSNPDVIIVDGVGATNGVFATDVINKSGATLPETGGIGTTIFYVVGMMLVLGAGVVMIARRRVVR